MVAGGREHVFWGFENYDRVQAPLIRSEQRKYTTMLPLHEVEEVSWQPLLFGGLDGLLELINFAKGVSRPCKRTGENNYSSATLPSQVLPVRTYCWHATCSDKAACRHVLTGIRITSTTRTRLSPWSS